MAVIARFIYDIKPRRFDDFMVKLRQAAGAQFNSPVMPQSVRLFRSSVPGPDTRQIILDIEYADMAAYGARTVFETNDAEWRELFASRPDSPEQLVSVALLTEL